MDEEYDNLEARNRNQGKISIDKCLDNTSLSHDTNIAENNIEKPVVQEDNSIISASLNSLTPRWRNWALRTIFTLIMIAGFLLIIYLGPLYMVLLVLAIEVMCFREIIKIGHYIYRAENLPWFRTLSWPFLIASNYFLFGESFIGIFRNLLHKKDLLNIFIVHHRFISFSLYCACIVGFVLSLKKKHYLKQFILFGWTHVTLILIVTSSHMIILNIFNGIIWFIVPCSMIISNDIFAYIFGFFFGKTPLIKLSPKKTWEGFLGGALGTAVFSLGFSLYLIQFDQLVCPLVYEEVEGALHLQCTRQPVFRPQPYSLPNFWSESPIIINIYPFLFHCVFMVLFASIVGPFGGFFASGFKRAFKIKDFGDIIPGHGGIMDRFDCQVLMGFFTYVYYKSFIEVPEPDHILRQVYFLSGDDQLRFYNLLTNGLIRRGILPNLDGV